MDESLGRSIPIWVIHVAASATTAGELERVALGLH